MRRRTTTPALIALCVAGAVLLPGHAAEAQSDPVGVWNVRSRDMTDRASGGVRVVLLRVQEVDGELAAEITSIRNEFTPVEEFRHERGTMRLVYGSYEYMLRVDGDVLTGTLVSPLGTQEVEGVRQSETLTYVGDEPDEFRTTRPGVLGHRTLLDPPQGESDPAGWVTSRIDSVGDLALIVGRRAKVAVSFTNAEEFADDLLRNAGRPVTVLGAWVGERLRIERIEPEAP
jgi:hypothetical protein